LETGRNANLEKNFKRYLIKLTLKIIKETPIKNSLVAAMVTIQQAHGVVKTW